MKLKYPEIPKIETLTEETRNNKNNVKSESMRELITKTIPVFQEILVQIEKAKNAGYNTCVIKCEDSEIVSEVTKKYTEAKYEVKYVKPTLYICWPL